MPLTARGKNESAFEQNHATIKTYVLDTQQCDELSGSREYQREALLKLSKWDFFDQDKATPRPALIEWPTGCGKTGLAVLAPYILNAHSVLVVTPSPQVTVQRGIAFGCYESPYTQPFLVKSGIVAEDDLKNFTPVATTALTTKDLNEAMAKKTPMHLIISNVHKFNGASTGVNLKDMPPDRFDLVIVDEAHHYPARTWKAMVDYFAPRDGSNKTRLIFLTAASKTSKGYILGRAGGFLPEIEPCHRMTVEEAQSLGVIRAIKFEEYNDASGHFEASSSMASPQHGATLAIAKGVVEKLQRHDQLDPTVVHKALVLCNGVEDARHVAETITHVGQISGFVAKQFVGGTDQQVLNDFCNPKDKKHRALTICGRLLEGFDFPAVSVVGIHRHVQSPVLFTQFVGRCVRTVRPDDPVEAHVVTHTLFCQREYYETLIRRPMIADVDPESLEEPPTGIDDALPAELLSSLDAFVKAVDDPVAAQLAVGAAVRKHWRSETIPDGLVYLTEIPAGDMCWAVTRDAVRRSVLYRGLQTPTQAAAKVAGRLVVVTLSKDNFYDPFVGHGLHLPHHDLQRGAYRSPGLKAAQEVLLREVKSIFQRRRLVVAAFPCVVKDEAEENQTVIALVVRGLGKPLDEERLPQKLGSIPTRVLLGLPPQSCGLQLDPSPAAGAPYLADSPLHAPAALEGPPDDQQRHGRGTFGAYATRGADPVVVTAAHVLMSGEEWDDFEYRNDVRDEYPEGPVVHRLATQKPIPVGTRHISSVALERRDVDAGLVVNLHAEWVAQPDERHIIPGFVFDGFHSQDRDYDDVFPKDDGHTLYGRPAGNLSHSGISLTGVVDIHHLDDDVTVGKVGMTTGLTFGHIISAGVATAGEAKWPYGPQPLDRLVRVGQIAVEPWQQGGHFCDSGDSGSLVWTANGTSKAKIIGILHTKLPVDGVGTLGVVTPATRIEEAYGIKFCVGSSAEHRTLSS